MAERIQRKRTKGWRMPEGAVYVGRPTRWGNPFTTAGAIEAGFAADDADARPICVYVFRSWLTQGPQSPWWFDAGKERFVNLRGALDELRGRDLVCWCPLEQPCHADVLLEVANQ